MNFCEINKKYAFVKCPIFIFQRQLSIFRFTLNYPPIRNNLTSASLLSMLIETDYLNYPSNQKQSFICKSAIVLRRRDTKDTKQYLIKCFRSMTMASLLSMLIETDYNFKKITAVFLRVLFKRITFCLELPVYKTKRKTFQHNHLLLEICWGYLFCSIR